MDHAAGSQKFVDGAPRAASGQQRVRPPAQEGRNLENIANLLGDLGRFWFVDVS